jgi:hypothetical protein
MPDAKKKRKSKPRRRRKDSSPAEDLSGAPAGSDSSKPAPTAEQPDKEPSNPDEQRNAGLEVEILPASPDYRLRNADGERLYTEPREGPKAEAYQDYDPEADPVRADLLDRHREKREDPEYDSSEARQAKQVKNATGRGGTRRRKKGAKHKVQPSQDWKLVLLQMAYDMIVREGKSIREAAQKLNCRHSLLVYYARKGRWMLARLQYESLDDESRHAEDLCGQAEANNQLILEKIRQCKVRMDLLEQAVQRKLAVVTSDVESVTFTSADGVSRTLAAPKASLEDIQLALRIHSDFMRQIDQLSKLNESRVLASLRRTQRYRRSTAGRRTKRETELLATHPTIEPSSARAADDELVHSPVEDVDLDED